MNIRSPFNPAQIGEWLAWADDQQQADLLNAWGKELEIACRGDIDMQLCYMSKHLDKKGQAFLDKLYSFAKMRKEE